jgi:hypothetical protein
VEDKSDVVYVPEPSIKSLFLALVLMVMFRKVASLW